MLNLPLMSAMEQYEWMLLGIIFLSCFFLRILMKFFISSTIMCFVFSIITVVLSIFVINTQKASDFGPWIFYTTFSLFMFCLGPTYFEEGSYFEITVHQGIFSNSVEGATRSRSFKFYYFFSRLALTFVAVNIVGFNGNPYLFFVPPAICSIVSLIRLIIYLKS